MVKRRIMIHYIFQHEIHNFDTLAIGGKPDKSTLDQLKHSFDPNPEKSYIFRKMSFLSYRTGFWSKVMYSAVHQKSWFTYVFMTVVCVCVCVCVCACACVQVWCSPLCDRGTATSCSGCGCISQIHPKSPDHVFPL